MFMSHWNIRFVSSLIKPSANFSIRIYYFWFVVALYTLNTSPLSNISLTLWLAFFLSLMMSSEEQIFILIKYNLPIFSFMVSVLSTPRSRRLSAYPKVKKNIFLYFLQGTLWFYISHLGSIQLELCLGQMLWGRDQNSLLSLLTQYHLLNRLSFFIPGGPVSPLAMDVISPVHCNFHLFHISLDYIHDDQFLDPLFCFIILSLPQNYNVLIYNKSSYLVA